MKRVQRLLASTALCAGLTAALFGCGSPPPQAFNPAGDPASLVKQYVEIKKAENLKGIKKVAIPEFFVQFVTRSAAGASATDTTSKSVAVHATYNLKDVTNEQLQAVADKMYDQLVAELTAAGIEVVPTETYAGSEHFKTLVEKAKKPGLEVATTNETSLFVGAKGLPLYFEPTDKRLGFGDMFAAQFSNFNPERYEKKLAKELNAAVMRVNFAVTFASMSTKGGWASSTASVKANLKVTVRAKDTNYKIVSPNGYTGYTLKEPVFADGGFITEVADALTAGDKTANALSGAFGAMGGGHTSKTRKYDVHTDSAAYVGLVETHISAIDKLIFSSMKANF